MEVKVLLTLEWHEGIPDGENEVSFVLPEFDIEDAQKRDLTVKEALVQYGVDESSLKRDELFSSDRAVVFTADIARFENVLPNRKPHLFTCTIYSKFRYVWEHRGRVYELNQIDANIVDLNKVREEG